MTSADGTETAEVARAWAFDALGQLSDGIAVVDAKAHLVYLNAAGRELAGVSSLFGDPALWSAGHGIYHADEKTQVATEDLALVRALKGISVRDAEYFIRNKRVPNGAHILVSATPLRDASGVVRGAACIFRETTEPRAREARLRESERRTKAILDSIPDMAWLKDQSGRFLAVNRSFANAAGRSNPDDVIGLTDLDLWPRELAERYRADDEEVMRSDLDVRIEEPFVDASGNTAWIETIKQRVVDASGTVLGITGIARDITERKRAEEAVRIARDELEKRVEKRTAELAEAQENLVRQERLAVLGQLAGGVAHQIRNPLAAIMNATYVLRRHVAPAQHPNVEDALRIIHDEVRHANVIITGLLDYARVRTPNRHPTSLPDLVERVLAAALIPESVRVERKIDSELPLLEVDADHLHGALLNLVRNAVDAMSFGGTLRVELSATSDHAVFAVADTGPGISPQVRAHLFEPLHSTKPLGIGLGLVTARRFVEAHGGSIASVDVAIGARFEIRLPLR